MDHQTRTLSLLFDLAAKKFEISCWGTSVGDHGNETDAKVVAPKLQPGMVDLALHVLAYARLCGLARRSPILGLRQDSL